jgi:hypothetical protein
MSLELPTIHLNGTSKERLLEAINDAYWKIGEAQRALAETTPNGRDYYTPQRDYDRLAKATNEHYARMLKLADILKELEELAEGIDTQA